MGEGCYPELTGSHLSLHHEDGPFKANLATLVRLIKAIAVDRSNEHVIELVQLRDITQRSINPINWVWLPPSIKTILATRLEALVQLEYGDLDYCLDRFYASLLLLAETGAHQAYFDLYELREHILESADAQFSRWLIGTIDAAIGRKPLIDRVMRQRDR
jgi:hypothetical protein